MSVEIRTLTNRPKDIFTIVDKAFFSKDLGKHQHDDYILSGNCYENYYELAKIYQPKSILEIGVRLGYSLISLIKGCSELEYVEGWDIPKHRNTNYVDNCLDGLSAKMVKCCGNAFTLNLVYNNSQKVETISRPYDLIHIDGGHTTDEKIHDLKLAMVSATKVIVVDDYKCKIVGGACNRFLKQYGDRFKKVYQIDSKWGTLVMEV